MKNKNIIKLNFVELWYIFLNPISNLCVSNIKSLCLQYQIFVSPISKLRARNVALPMVIPMIWYQSFVLLISKLHVFDSCFDIKSSCFWFVLWYQSFVLLISKLNACDVKPYFGIQIIVIMCLFPSWSASPL